MSHDDYIQQERASWIEAVYERAFHTAKARLLHLYCLLGRDEFKMWQWVYLETFRYEALIRSLKCLPPVGECTWKNGEQPYKCAHHPEYPWPGHQREGDENKCNLTLDVKRFMWKN